MAKTNTKGIADKLRSLYQLQLIDSKIDEIHILRGELPIEVCDLEDELAGLGTRLQKTEKLLEDIQNDINNYLAKIKESEMMIEKYNRQLDEVKNNREFDALNKEIELQKLEIQLSEKRIREAEINKSNKSETINFTRDRYNQRQKALAAKKDELEKIIEKTEKDEKSLRKKSGSVRDKIEQRLLDSYDRIRTRYRNGLAVVTIQRQACGGCFNRLPPQIQIDITQRKAVIACEHCGRVIIDDQMAEEEGIK